MKQQGLSQATRPARRPRRADLHLVSNDGESELYVARSTRALRPRRIDLARLKGDPGRELKRLRRGLRVSLPQVESATRIGVRHLAALESNATADAFPAALYARAFLREYARYLRVDPEPILAAHAATRDMPEPAALSTMLPPPESTQFRLPRWTLTAVCGTALLILLLATGGHGERPAGASGSTPAPHASVGLGVAEPGLAPPAALDPTPAAAQVSGIAVELRAEGAPCWVRVTTDGKPSFAQTLRPGVGLQFRGERRVDLAFGNARAARLTVNGHAIELGRTQILRLRITLTGGHVTVRTTSGDLIASF